VTPRLLFLGRREPYTALGIRRVPCARCGKPSRHQWQVCANGNRFMGVCGDCDITLNAIALSFFRFPPDKRAALMNAYRERIRG
jgi:hypothetical protein